MNGAEAVVLAAISPWLALGLAAVIALLIKVPMRLFGRWLERKGRSMEGERDESEPAKRYDPFEAGRR